MLEAPKQLKVFLCHSSHDKPVVRELYQKLGAEGWIDPWLDEKKLLPGQDWNMEIEKAVETSHIVLVFLTNNSVNKEGYIQRELRRVLDVALNMTEDTIFVIPLKLEECEMPRSLRTWQWLNYFPASERADAYERLIASLKIRANKLSISTDSAHVGKKVEFAPAPRKFPPPVETPPADSDLDLYIPPEYVGATFTPPPAKVKTWTFGGIEFVKVSHGEFLMGSKKENKLAFDDEKSQHIFNIPYDFLIARFLVTNEQFSEFVKVMGFKNEWGVSDWQDKLKHPLVNISWQDALVYCDWLNQQFGKNVPRGLSFRLSTEAEWEKAARGIAGHEWPWGNEFYKDKCNSKESGKGGTTPVGAYSPVGDSPFGVCDMAGNVWEWTASLWGKKPDAPDFKYPYNPRDGRENLKAGDDVFRVLRGGSFRDESQVVRATFRGGRYPLNRFEYRGFRVVLAPRLS